MTVEEYADFEIANGTEAVRVDGVWWRSVRPFFFQPLFPFLELLPHSAKPPRSAFFGGFQHLVPDGETANSQKNFFIWDDVAGYSLSALNHTRRSSIKKGMRHFSIREIADREEMVSAGHSVYRSFYERTGYRYKKERTDKDHFRQWASALYRFPKVKLLGAYHKGELCAVDISYVVQDVLIEATFFSKTEYLQYRVADAMVHTLREMAAASGNIRFIYKGPVTGLRGLDESKLIRGCKILSKPAYYQLHPLALFVLSTFMKQKYEKLVGHRDIDPSPHPPGENRTPDAEGKRAGVQKKPSLPPA
jgi:hypothetical protein